MFLLKMVVFLWGKFFMTPITLFGHMNEKGMPNSKSAHQIAPGSTKTLKPVI